MKINSFKNIALSAIHHEKLASCGIKIIWASLIITLMMLLNLQSLQAAHAEQSPNASQNTKYITLDADFSGNAKTASIAIERGITLALSEINAQGGIHGTRIGLKTYNHRANPSRGLAHIHQIQHDQDIIGVIGGVHTPVALEQIPLVHQYKIPYLSAWAAGTQITENGYTPNYAFRLSANDKQVAEFFLQEIQNRGFKNVAVFLEKTGWGRSNHHAIKQAAKDKDLTIQSVDWFFWGNRKNDFKDRLKTLADLKIDAIILVANATEGAEFIQAMADMDSKIKNIPVISHWGIAASDFPSLTQGAHQKINLTFLQTWSNQETRAQAFMEKYCNTYEMCPPSQHSINIGVAHGYDLMHLIAKALEHTDVISRQSLFEGLHHIEKYEGIIKTYNNPFSENQREALNISDFGLYRYNQNGQIVKAQ